MQFDEFLSVIDLLKDTKKYEAKVAELKAREQAIQDSITQLNVVGDINKAQSKANAAVLKAEDMLSAASKQADQIIAAAQVVFDKRHTDLKEREMVAEQAISDYHAIKSQLASREEVFRSKEKAVESLREILQKQQDEFTAKHAEVDERLAKLRQVMG